MGTNSIVRRFSAILLPLVISLGLVNLTRQKAIYTFAFFTTLMIVICPTCYFVLFILTRSSVDTVASRQIIASHNLASVLSVFVLVAGALVFFRNRALTRMRQRSCFMTVNVGFVMLLTSALLSLINTHDIRISAGDYLRLMAVWAVFNIANIKFSDDGRFRHLLWFVVLSSAVPLGFGIHQLCFGTGNLATTGFNRIYGTFVHPNVFGQYLVILFFSALFLLREYRRTTVGKILLFGMLSLIVFELYHTFTRSAWIALLISLIAYSFSYRRLWKHLAHYCVIVFLIYLVYEGIESRFLDVIYPRLTQVTSWDWRLLTWKETIRGVGEHAIIGHGLGMYEDTYRFMAHNDYLRLAYEIGLLGLSCYLAILGYLLCKSAKMGLFSVEDRERNRGVLMLCLVASFLIMSISDNLARSTVILAYLFSVFGGALGRAENGA